MCNASHSQWMFVYFHTSTSPPPSSFDEESQHAPLTEVLTCHCQPTTTTARSSFTNRPFPALLLLHPRQHPRQQQHHHHLRADQVAENSFNIINVAPPRPPPRTGSNYTRSSDGSVADRRKSADQARSWRVLLPKDGYDDDSRFLKYKANNHWN